jgi:hypothetical protein
LNADQRSGLIDIMLKRVQAGNTSTPTKNLEVLIYDDQADSYPSLTPEMTCEQKRARAKNYEDLAKYFAVAFDTKGYWYSNHVPIADHKPRDWYLVLAKCGGGAFTVEHDLKWTHTGVFAAGTGPFQCTAKPEDTTYFSDGGQGIATGLVVSFVVLTLIACTLCAVLIRECARTQDVLSGKAKQSVALDDFNSDGKVRIMRNGLRSDVADDADVETAV